MTAYEQGYYFFCNFNARRKGHAFLKARELGYKRNTQDFRDFMEGFEAAVWDDVDTGEFLEQQAINDSYYGWDRVDV